MGIKTCLFLRRSPSCKASSSPFVHLSHAHAYLKPDFFPIPAPPPHLSRLRTLVQSPPLSNPPHHHPGHEQRSAHKRTCVMKSATLIMAALLLATSVTGAPLQAKDVKSDVKSSRLQTRGLNAAESEFPSLSKSVSNPPSSVPLIIASPLTMVSNVLIRGRSRLYNGAHRWRSICNRQQSNGHLNGRH